MLKLGYIFRVILFLALPPLAGLLCGCEEKPSIILGENPWLGSAINAQAARIVMEEKLGYPVTVIRIDENAQWEPLARGELHAVLEIWPSGHAGNIAKYIKEEKTIENMGLLGVVGKIGWYVPSYLVQQYPALADWQGLQDPKNAALFKTPESGEKGRFLAGDPSWPQHDGEIIHNLGLNFQVQRVESEKAIMKEVESAYRNGRPVLFYFWSPHFFFVKLDLTEVRLPPYHDRCYAKAPVGGVDCGYPPEVLFKAAWPGLKEKAPEVFQFLKNFVLTNEDQLEMMALAVNEGLSVEQAVRVWLDNNEKQWRPWLLLE
ncbi:MAG: ABC transporter substrate-binding protein [Pseudomonadota bacterium]